MKPFRWTVCCAVLCGAVYWLCMVLLRPTQVVLAAVEGVNEVMVRAEKGYTPRVFEGQLGGRFTLEQEIRGEELKKRFPGQPWMAGSLAECEEQAKAGKAEFDKWIFLTEEFRSHLGMLAIAGNQEKEVMVADEVVLPLPQERIQVVLPMLTLLGTTKDVEIVGPIEVKPGAIASFMLEGLPSKYLSAFDWVIIGKPDDALVIDVADRKTGAPILIFQTSTAGSYALIAGVFVEPVTDCRLLVHEFTVGKPDPDPDPPLPPPPPSDLTEFVAELVNKLDIETRSEQVIGLFRDAIAGIDDDKLLGSKAIVEAVSKRIVAMDSTKWHAFSTLLYQRLINELKLVTQAQWKDAYKQVILGLEKSK